MINIRLPTIPAEDGVVGDPFVPELPEKQLTEHTGSCRTRSPSGIVSSWSLVFYSPTPVGPIEFVAVVAVSLYKNKT